MVASDDLLPDPPDQQLASNTSNACPFCGSREAADSGSISSRLWVRCRHCGFDHFEPRDDDSPARPPGTPNGEAKHPSTETETEAQQVLAEARRREAARAHATPPIDYDRMKSTLKRQRGALTRAVRTGDVDKVTLTVRDAVREWNQPGSAWPDDWTRWQRALNDLLPLDKQIDIADLA